MLTPRRQAQLAIVAASLTLVSTFTILIAGASEKSSAPKPSQNASPTQITPLATGPLGMVSPEDSRLSLDR